MQYKPAHLSKFYIYYFIGNNDVNSTGSLSIIYIVSNPVKYIYKSPSVIKNSTYNVYIYLYNLPSKNLNKLYAK